MPENSIPALAVDERQPVEPFPDLPISDAERDRLVAKLQAEESELSYERRLLHGHIDMLRAERTARLKRKPEGELAKLGDERMNEAVLGAPHSVVGAGTADAFPDLAKLSDAELDDVIAQLEAKENDLSYRRRMLQGRIDILRSDATGGDLGQLAEILSGKPSSGSGAATPSSEE